MYVICVCGIRGGSIGVVAGDIVVGSGSAGLRFLSTGPAIQPRNADGTANNDAIDIGLSGNRFKDLYLSGGAYLGGTAAANKLDDYEEGTWTPTLYAATTGTNRVTAHTSSTYTKVGRLVRCKTYLNQIDGTALNGDTGAITLAGLPFTPTSFGHLYSIYNNLSDLGITAYASSTSIVLLRDDGHASLTPSNINTGTRQTMIDITFEVA